MKRGLTFAALLFAAGLAAAPAEAPSEREELASVKAGAEFPPDKVVPYRSVDGKDLVLNCFFPKDWKASDSRPAILFFHGGGWSAGDPAQFFLHASSFRDRGFVAFSVSYRLGKTGDDIRNAVADARSAVRFVRSYAARFGINPDRLIYAGSSAGSHLSLAAMLCDGIDNPEDDLAVSTRPAGIILFSPVVDCGPDSASTAYRKLGEKYPPLSPIHRLRENMAPILLILGSDDNKLSESQANSFAAAVKAKGGSCQVAVFPGLKHGAFYSPKNFNTATGAINQFLADYQLGD